MEKGRVVIKLNGRFAGYPGVILEVLNDSYVKIGIILKGNIIKEKKSNVKHIIPLSYKVDPSKLNDAKAIIETVPEIKWGKRIPL